MTYRLFLPQILLLLALLPAPGLLQAAPIDTDQAAEGVRLELAALEKNLESIDNTLQARRKVSTLRKRLVAIRGETRDCIAAAVDSITSLTSKREALGAAVSGEDAAITRSRSELGSEINKREKQRVACELLAQSSQTLFDRVQEYEKAALRARLFARGLSTEKVLAESLTAPLGWSRIVSGFIAEGSGWERLANWQRWCLAVAAGVLLAFGFAAQVRRFKRHQSEGRSRHVYKALPWLLASAGTAAALMLFLPVWPPALVTRLVLGVLAWLVFDTLLQVWLTGRVAAGLAQQDARSLVHWVRVLTGLVILGGLVSTAESIIQLPDAHYFLMRLVMVWLLLAGLVVSAFVLGRVPGLAGTRSLRVIMVLSVVVIAIAETLGYRNLSMYLLLGFSGTVLGFWVFNLVASTLVYIYDGLDSGQYPSQKLLRKKMGLKARENVPGLIWLRLATSLAVWSVFVLWVMWVWGQSGRWITQLAVYFTEGFELGSLRIAPVQILGAIAAMALGLLFTRWIKDGLVTNLVKRTRLDRGGREAMVTVSGYVGFMLSVLIALGVAGISYTNLAIVAGALSVGIGFGLQNVVNNFVSGLILLFERPVRTGDWIVVGDTQGYVRKISIRSTQIETFDRADVIVPNSELISNKVSNWMLSDPWGRIKIPVGVAYGSDTGKVIEILVRIGSQHEGVMKDHATIPGPKVLFRQFGDSALEFELRCFIRQIDRMLDITSDLNLAIDREFRAAGITIPFPQRDIHMMTPPPEDDSPEE